RLRAATRSRVVPSCPAILRFLLKHRDDERILGRKPAIEARLRHARLRDDRVDADGVDAVAIKEIARRIQDAVADTFGRCARRGFVHTRFCRFRHSSPSQLDSATDLYVASRTDRSVASHCSPRAWPAQAGDPCGAPQLL